MGVCHSSPTKAQAKNAIDEILSDLERPQREKVKKELKSYDIVLVANNTTAMGKVCDDKDLRRTLVNLAKVANAFDSDGFDLHLVNGSNGSQKYKLLQQEEDESAIEELLEKMPFIDGKLKLSDKLQELVNLYKESNHKRKMNYIILLSECVSKDSEQAVKLQEFIKETVSWMKRQKLGRTQIGFQFVQIGDDRQTRGILHHLDTDMKEQDPEMWDIVDRTTLRTPNATLIVKVLLGGILRRVDEKGAASIIGPNWFTSLLREDPNEHVQKQIQVLIDYDTIVLVDDSASMSETDWRMARDALDMLINLTGERDTDGIDIYFVNAVEPFKNVKSEFQESYHNNIDSIKPSGNAPLRDKLEHLVNQYLNRISQPLSLGETVFKPENYIVITNGLGLKDQGLKEFIIATASRLDTKKFEQKKTIGIQFLQIGNNEDVTNFFKDLDDNAGAKFDIVDTTLYRNIDPVADDTVAKILLGGIVQKIDQPKKSRRVRAYSESASES